jgi:hypothetical protein
VVCPPRNGDGRPPETSATDCTIRDFRADGLTKYRFSEWWRTEQQPVVESDFPPETGRPGALGAADPDGRGAARFRQACTAGWRARPGCGPSPSGGGPPGGGGADPGGRGHLHAPTRYGRCGRDVRGRAPGADMAGMSGLDAHPTSGGCTRASAQAGGPIGGWPNFAWRCRRKSHSSRPDPPDGPPGPAADVPPDRRPPWPVARREPARTPTPGPPRAAPAVAGLSGEGLPGLLPTRNRVDSAGAERRGSILAGSRPAGPFLHLRR